MKIFDIAIIGGGMVGLALAASLRNSPVKIAVIEGFPNKEPIEQLSNRVSAINLASEKMLQNLEVWQALLNLRATAYDKMDVWEKDSFAQIQFDTQSLGLEHLGILLKII